MTTKAKQHSTPNVQAGASHAVDTSGLNMLLIQASEEIFLHAQTE